MSEAAASVESVDPTQTTVPASTVNETQSADADFAAALKAFRSATGAPESAPEAPKTEPEAKPQPDTKTPPEAAKEPEKVSSDLTAILARMQRFEDERAAAQTQIAELQKKLADQSAQLDVKNPIEFLKQRGFSQEQVQDWLLNGGKSEVAQKSEMEQLKERLARFEQQEQERSQRTAAEQQEAKRAAAEKHYRDNVIGKAVDATKYPLLHTIHAPAEIVDMAYQHALAHYKRTNQEPDINTVLGSMENTLSELRDKLSPKQAPRTSAPALSELASHSQAGTGGTEAEDDASALAAASALAKQMLAKK